MAITKLPVISCTTTYGGPTPQQPPFVPAQLPTTTTTAKGLDYYSNGLITVLGPAGWSCSALVAGDGGEGIDVVPPGTTNANSTVTPKGKPVVQVAVDYTGHIPGADLVCALFPNSAAATFVKQPGESCQPLAAGEKTKQLTPDVVTFVDPPGVAGSATGSGGSLASLGAAVYPQVPYGADDSVTVDVLSCTLGGKLAAACRSIEGDFLVRNPPTYVPPPDTGNTGNT